MKNLFKYLVLGPQIIVAADALYTYVSSLDDDPEVQAVWESVKENAVIASRVAILRMQFEGLRELIKQLK